MTNETEEQRIEILLKAQRIVDYILKELKVKYSNKRYDKLNMIVREQLRK